MTKQLLIKLKESALSIFPITLILTILHLTVTPLPSGLFWLFIFASVVLVFGIAFFSLGADIAMMPMGNEIGSQLSKFSKVGIAAFVIFIFGVFVALAEPNLQLLANQIPAIDRNVLIISVAVGVGFCLMFGLLRIVFHLRLNFILIIAYGIIFVLAVFVPPEFLAVAFDAGGVVTGPVVVPYIMALGIGVAAVRGGKSSQDDSFGLVAFVSIGPILTILILGLIYQGADTVYEPTTLLEVHSIQDIFRAFSVYLAQYVREVTLALAPMVVFFGFFQVFFLKLPKRKLQKIAIGVIYTYVGLVLFLAAVSVGFSGIGSLVGGKLAALNQNWVLIPLGFLIGFVIVIAEPSVHVLNKQVEDITVGAITKKSMLLSLSIGVGTAIAFSMIRVLYGVSIWWFIVPGYAIALILTFFVPKIFTAIAFDSGGVASGPMTVTFILPFAIGAAETIGAATGQVNNVLLDAFGIVSIVAMTPLIMIQLLGVIYQYKVRSRKDAMDMIMEQPVDETIIVFDEEEENSESK